MLIFGHKNPDSDSILSAIALANLKKKLNVSCKACRLGSIPRETQFVLDKFNIKAPEFIENVKIQIKDLDFDKSKTLLSNHSIEMAYRIMEEEEVKTLAIVNSENQLLGIVTMKDIAMALMKVDFCNIKSSIQNIAQTINGNILNQNDTVIEGEIPTIASRFNLMEEAPELDENSILLTSDFYKIIENAIEKKVKLIIVTGVVSIPNKYISLAKNYGVNLLATSQDIYKVSKVLIQSNNISSIMKTDNIITFHEDEYFDDLKDVLSKKNHQNYPVLGKNNQFLGFVNRKHIINPTKKQVVLVDHNEYAQSAEGIEEANVLEIIDHHKIGGINTSMPIHFYNKPVGSTCSLVYDLYRSNNIEVDYSIAGALISGILSDTLILNSPTTTDFDRQIVSELNEIVKLDIESYALDMFKSGSSIQGQTISDVFKKDFKEFSLNEYKFGISQVFTLDVDEIFAKKDEFLSYMKELKDSKNHCIDLMIVTDIIKQGSYVFFVSDFENIISLAFSCENKQGSFVEQLVSRKKQVVPNMLKALNSLI